MTNEVVDAIKTGVVSKKNPITVLKRALNKHTKTSIDTLVATMNSTKDEKLKASIATTLLRHYTEVLKQETDEKHRTKEFYLKHKDQLLALANNGTFLTDDNDDDDDDSPILDFENISVE
jgi:hypothetical protein